MTPDNPESANSIRVVETGEPNPYCHNCHNIVMEWRPIPGHFRCPECGATSEPIPATSDFYVKAGIAANEAAIERSKLPYSPNTSVPLERDQRLAEMRESLGFWIEHTEYQGLSCAIIHHPKELAGYLASPEMSKLWDYVVGLLRELSTPPPCKGTGDPITNICPLCGKWDEHSQLAWQQATPEQREHWDELGAPDNGVLPRSAPPQATEALVKALINIRDNSDGWVHEQAEATLAAYEAAKEGTK